jgi:hypothetical protein
MTGRHAWDGEHDPQLDAEQAKQLTEQLDTVWGGLFIRIRTDENQEQLAREFVDLLRMISEHSEARQTWTLISRWAEDKAV